MRASNQDRNPPQDKIKSNSLARWRSTKVSWRSWLVRASKLPTIIPLPLDTQRTLRYGNEGNVQPLENGDARPFFFRVKTPSYAPSTR